MRELKELQHLIEKARLELDQALESDSYEIYYQKSVYLDKLIEAILLQEPACDSMPAPMSSTKNSKSRYR